MSTLIIDPSREYREIAYRLVKWADHRHSVELVENGAGAWNTAVEWRPGLILCEPGLPDMPGAELCMRLRERLPHTKFVAYTENERVGENEQNAFDGILFKPPSRLAVLSYLNAAKKRKKSEVGVAFPNTNVFLDERRCKTWRRKKTGALATPIQVSVRVADDNMLTFSLPMPAGSTVGELLRQIGKVYITWFALIRQGNEIEAGVHTHISEGDVLLIRS
jgi:CheY-like chemotaxis protein